MNRDPTRASKDGPAACLQGSTVLMSTDPQNGRGRGRGRGPDRVTPGKA